MGYSPFVASVIKKFKHEHYYLNRDAILQEKHDYYYSHHGVIRDRVRKWYRANAERIKQQRKFHKIDPIKRREQRRRWYEQIKIKSNAEKVVNGFATIQTICQSIVNKTVNTCMNFLGDGERKMLEIS